MLVNIGDQVVGIERFIISKQDWSCLTVGVPTELVSWSIGRLIYRLLLEEE